MTDQHPITPPPELVTALAEQAPRYRDGGVGRELWMIDRAAQWGADQELEACCEWLSKYLPYLRDFPKIGDILRAARRPSPKPPETIEVDGFTYKLVE